MSFATILGVQPQGRSSLRLERNLSQKDREILTWPLLGLLWLCLLGPLGICFYGIPKPVEYISLGSLLILTVFVLFLKTTPLYIRALLVGLPLVVIVLAVVWGALFSMRTHADALPSIMAFRWQLYWLVAPCIIAIRRAGVRSTVIIATIAISLLVTLCALMHAQLTWDLVQKSVELTQTGQRNVIRSADDLRGGRLPTPYYCMETFLMLSLCYVWTGGRNRKIVLGFIAFLAWVYFYEYSRTEFLFVAIGILVARVLTLRASAQARAAILFTLGTGLVASFVGFYATFATYVGGDRSGLVRLNTLQIIWSEFQQHPFLGYGQDSAQSVTYENIFGATFFPADLGYLGYAFSYGLLGVGIVIFIIFVLTQNALKKFRETRARRYKIVSFSVLSSIFSLSVGGGIFNTFTAPDGVLAFALLAALPTLALSDDAL